MRRQAMAEDFSWRHEAEGYEQLYLEAYRRRRGHDFGGPRPLPPQGQAPVPASVARRRARAKARRG
jgi:hypothetical protein